MSKTAISRRTLLEAGAWSLASTLLVPEIGAAHAAAGSALSPKLEATVRKYYSNWETKDWHAMDALLAEDFTFSSPVDDRISKAAFKKGCWDTQIAFIRRFDIWRVVGTHNEAFVMYICHTMNDKMLRNVEYLQLKEQQVAAVECYFGAQNSFPSAVSG